MSVKQIPNLTTATSLNGTEQMEAVQSGSSVRLTVAQIGTYINAQYPAPGISSVTATSPLTSSTVSGAVTISLPSQSITNAYLATMAAGTVKANITGSSSTPSDVTPSAILDTFGSTTGMTLYRGSSSWQALTAGTNAQILRANGTTSAPSWSSLGTLLDTALGSAQGSIAYRNSSEWTALSPGVYGQVLQTQGPSADPAWISVAGVGTVTSIATGTGLTGGPITASGTISIANTGVSAGTYGAAASIPSFSVNAQGQLTSISSVSVDGVTLTTGTISGVPSNGIDIANKDYVDSVAQGLNFHAACNYGSTAALPTYVYNNGTSGVGATITASANGALVLDGHTFVSPTDVGLRVLIKDETSTKAPYNGVYTVTATGAAGAVFVLTRATDYDTSGTGTNEIDAGDFLLVLSGATLANTSWVQQTPLPIVVGTTAIVFTQFGAPILYSAGTGLTLAGTVFSITNTAVTAGSYGSASSVGTFSVNAQGQLTLAASTSIAIAATQVTTGTLAVARGGTGISSYVIGDLIYASGATALSTLADVATGNALISGGVGVAPSWSKIGLTTHVTGTLGVGNGGTGLATIPANGALLIGNGTNYTSATLTAGTNIAITNGSGSISIATSATPSFATSITTPIVYGGTTASSSLTLQSTSGVGTSDSILFKVGNNGATTAMTVNTSGNVGIGKTPGVSAMLDVLGNATFGSTIANGNGVSTGTASIELGGNRTGDGVSFIDIHSTSGSDYETRIIRDGGTNGVFSIINQGTGTFALTAVGAANMAFQTSNTERMRIDSSGNVGIGTSSPSYKLSVSGTTVGSTVWANVNNTDTTSGSAAGYFASNGAVNAVMYSSSNGGGGTYGMTTNHLMVLITNNTERIRIDSSGNVGIGTATAASKLRVVSSSTTAYSFTALTPVVGLVAGDYVNMAYFANSRSTNNDGLRIVNVRDSTGSGVGDWQTESYRIRRSVDQNDGATGVQEEIVFGASLIGFNVDGAERMRIDTSGNVGIGATANASAILDAQSTTKGVRFPNMTTTQKNAVSSPAAGLVVFDTTLAKLCVYSGSAWQTITSI